ncbi:sorting nexin-20-like [Lycorma delicatula]|uniref:sorting nexin-20-like n=1 Tax=Lycorma delicatula TaxID=130591 RepID=UPI003F5184B3
MEWLSPCLGILTKMDFGKLERKSENKTVSSSNLAFSEERSTSSETSAYIQSWITTAKNDPERKLRRSDSEGTPMLIFEIVSTRTVDNPNDKKHVAYTVMVRKEGIEVDPYPSIIERRYTEFLTLYLCLRQSFPSAFTAFNFPKKLLTGNFAPESISARSVGFEALLSIAAQHTIRDSLHVTSFMQNRELIEAKSWIQSERYDQAIPLVENTFRLLNKLYTDRHPAVLRTLCLLVGCCDADNHSGAVTFADLALHRYEAVSDTDLLRYYVPLLKLCIKLYWNVDKEKTLLEDRVADLKRRGIKVDGVPTLLEAVMRDTFGS